MPRKLSDSLGISPDRLEALGVLDPILDFDTHLSIDPLLLSSSRCPELSGAYQRFQDHFRKLLLVLSKSTATGDVFWDTADKLLTFPEAAGICIGTAKSADGGSGMGPEIRARLLDTASKLVAAGLDDPEIFELCGLFEKNIGADRISDMTARIIRPDLAAHTDRVMRELDLPGHDAEIEGTNYLLPKHELTGEPVLLVPLDILREIPTGMDWSSAELIAEDNADLRDRVNDVIGSTWASAARAHKDDLKRVLLEEPSLVEELIALYRAKPKVPYDSSADPAGELKWLDNARDFASRYPISMPAQTGDPDADVKQVAEAVVAKFRHLVENCGYSELLFHDDGRPRREAIAQRAFFGVAVCYCEANNVDVSPEAKAGLGPVDFKLSRGHVAKVLVEVKLSKNGKLIDGYLAQLDAYKAADQTKHAIYLVVKVGNHDKRLRNLSDAVAAAKAGGNSSDLTIVDATPKLPPSKRSAS